MTYRTRLTATPVCPHCGSAFTPDDMLAGGGDVALYALPTEEGRAELSCPAPWCGNSFYVQGGYVPNYTTAVDEAEL